MGVTIKIQIIVKHLIDYLFTQYYFDYTVITYTFINIKTLFKYHLFQVL